MGQVRGLMNSAHSRGVSHDSPVQQVRATETRSSSRRARSNSPDRNTRLLNLPPGNSRATSPTRELPADISSRDYADQNPSNSPRHPRARSAVFPWAPGSIRRRLNSMQHSTNPSPFATASSRGYYGNNRRRSVAVASTSARDTDDASHIFSLAGPQTIDSVTANQNYVDPGYTQLNPAYDQPTNVRPVWGLAKPLPRVVRSGMVPAKDELQREFEEEQADLDQGRGIDDLEAGRIEPSLRLTKVSSQLDTLRRERELSLFRAYRSLAPETPGQSPYGFARRPSDATTEMPDPRMRPDNTIFEETEEDRNRMQEPSESEFPQLSEAIAHIHRAREDEDLKVPYAEAIPLPAYAAEDDEVHNLHTYWSVVRLRFREPLAETLAILCQFTLGFSSNLVMTVSSSTAGVGDTTDWVWGFAAMVGIYIAGGISGAHLNPAMTFMFYIYRGFPLRRVPAYVMAQMLGAFLATLVSYGVFKPGLLALQREQAALEFTATATTTLLTPESLVNNFITSARHDWVDHPTAFFTELVGTTILAVTVLALGDDTNAPPGAGMNAFIIGLLVAILSVCFGYTTGLAMNPARDFGPRLGMTVLGYGKDVSLWADGYWFKVAWLGPLAGALLGGFLYDAAIFVGGESPVNYPSVRIWRAARKWKVRWFARFGRTKKKLGDIKDAIAPTGYERID